MAAHYAGQAVDVANPEPGEAERGCGLHQLRRMRGAVEEGEVGPRPKARRSRSWQMCL
jgi:hypothetical protein